MNQNFLPVVVNLDHRFAPTVVRVYVVEPYWHLHWDCRRDPYSVRQFQVRLLISDRLSVSEHSPGTFILFEPALPGPNTSSPVNCDQSCR
jgi:hypothetical protein